MNLREARFYRNMGQMELQKKSGVNQSRISSAENGVFKLRDDEKKRIEVALGMINKINFNMEEYDNKHPLSDKITIVDKYLIDTYGEQNGRIHMKNFSIKDILHLYDNIKNWNGGKR